MFTVALLVFLLNLCCYCQSIEVIVNCTWPCVDSSNACIVTASSIKCTSQHNSQWVLSQPTQSPIFMGDTARRNTPCVISPNPALYLSNKTTLSQLDETTQEAIIWPPLDTDRPLDKYLSDCDNNTYCDLADRICIDRLEQGSTCDSTNQCMVGLLCIETRCTGVRLSGSEDSDISGTKVHAAIIAAVVVAAVLAIASIVAVIYYRRKVLVLKRNKNTESPTLSPRLVAMNHLSPLPPASSAEAAIAPALLLPSPPPPAVITEPTPTMQQRHLQYQLHQQHASSVDYKDESTPPPPYYP